MRASVLVALYTFVLACVMYRVASSSCEDPPMPEGRADKLLFLAKESPRVVGIHDKESWLNLFAEGAVIQDPVGAPKHYDLGKFYDSFIGPNNISFVEKQDWVDADVMTVYRDVDIHIRFPGGYGKQVQPAHLMYTFNDDFKVTSLKAHWNLGLGYPLLDKQPVFDLAYYAVGATGSFYNFYKVLGLNFLYDYSKGLVAGYFSGGRRAVIDFIAAFQTQNQQDMVSLFAGPDTKITFRGGETLSAKRLLSFLKEKNTESIEHNEIYQSGSITSAVLQIKINGKQRRCISLFDVTHKQSKITKLTLIC